MGLSTSFDFTLNAGEAIKEAMENVSAIAIGEEPESLHIGSLMRTFNIMLKAKQSKVLGLWTWKDATLFLSQGTSSYRLGPSGDHATESYVQTTLAADAALGAGTVTLTSTSGISNADNIGIVLDSGVLFWTTATVAANTDLGAVLPSAASSGNVVFSYTTKIQRPLALKEPRLYHVDGSERPINVIPVSEYNLYPNKTVSSEIVSIAHEPLTDNTLLRVWPTNTLTTDVVKFSYKKPVDDIDNLENDLYAPVDCYAAIVAELTARFAVKYKLSIGEIQYFEARAKQAWEDMHDFEDDTSISFAPWSN